MVFAVALIVSNVVAAKTINTGIPLFGSTITVPGSALCYAVTFLMTDVIGEIWGRKEANKTVIFGFFCQVLATILIIATQYLPATDSEMQAAYKTVLGQNYIFVIGSMIAYFASQSWDVFIFHKIRNWYYKKHPDTGYKGKWLWNNGSTMTSQIIDTVLFIGICFGFGFKWFFNADTRATLFAMMIGQYILKLILAAIDTPFFYFFTRKSKTGEYQYT